MQKLMSIMLTIAMLGAMCVFTSVNVSAAPVRDEVVLLSKLSTESDNSTFNNLVGTFANNETSAHTHNYGAEDICTLRGEKKPDNRCLTVTYSAKSAYFVTIPEEVTLGTTATVKAEDVVIDEGKQLCVALTATSGTNNAFTVSNGGNGLLIYTVTNNNNTVSVGDTVLTVNPASGSAGSTTLNFNKPTDTAKYSGSYTGTVTFTVSVAD